MRTLRASSPAATAVKRGKKGEEELLGAVFPLTPAFACMSLFPGGMEQ